MNFPFLLILVIVFASISVGTTYAVLETFDDVKVLNNLIVDNKLGVGVDNPQTSLDIDGQMRVGGGRLIIGGFDNANNFWFRADTAEPDSVFFRLKQNPDGSANSVSIAPTGSLGIFVDSTGKVGIGKTNPSEALDVNGNIKLSGNIVSNNDICIGNCS